MVYLPDLNLNGHRVRCASQPWPSISHHVSYVNCKRDNILIKDERTNEIIFSTQTPSSEEIRCVASNKTTNGSSDFYEFAGLQMVISNMLWIERIEIQIQIKSKKIGCYGKSNFGRNSFGRTITWLKKETCDNKPHRTTLFWFSINKELQVFWVPNGWTNLLNRKK